MNVFILQKPTEILLKTSQINIGFKDFGLQAHIVCISTGVFLKPKWFIGLNQLRQLLEDL